MSHPGPPLAGSLRTCSQTARSSWPSPGSSACPPACACPRAASPPSQGGCSCGPPPPSNYPLASGFQLSAATVQQTASRSWRPWPCPPSAGRWSLLGTCLSPTKRNCTYHFTPSPPSLIHYLYHYICLLPSLNHSTCFFHAPLKTPPPNPLEVN